MENALLPTKRIESIDLLRGLVMIIMALDHTRDFFHIDAMTADPLNPETTHPFLYFTRWITHFCAPVFVFLAGASAWLQRGRKTKRELSTFLLTRGLWLILIEVTLITLGITGDIGFHFIILQTIWSIGISMIIIGLMIWLPFPVILTAGLLIVLGHNTLDFAEAARKGNVPIWWNFLHSPTAVPIGGGRILGIFYPFLPWAGLMMLGYCCGKVFTSFEAPKRSRILLWMGIGSLLLFVVLRLIDRYGDPLPWSTQRNGLYTFLSFMNVQKYPPSLLYMLATMGPAFLFLSLVKGAGGRLAEIIKVYGRVPFFYYILHFYLLNLIHIILYLAKGHSFSEGLKGVPGLPFKFAIPGEGYNLAVVYGIWIAVVIALYPLCKWFDRYKKEHRNKKWLSYL
ncbi:MAG: heparan-alpha-glucosaminide N-acetyltransferase domain-containing protein [Bacteroidetes bacterium]|nr:heparan-alpha-glucosaminide N-acetyltransferase domain-containing protein [Bacteroidota bacterium]